jgi:hypothetical protein
MPHLQTSESVVWVPDYEDIDLAEVEADLRRQEERRNPKKAEEERLKEAAKRTEAARIEAERQETERKAEAEKVDTQRRNELQELRQAEQREMAESQESARRLEESRSSELLEQAKAEAARAKTEAEKAKAEAARAKTEAEKAKAEAQRAVAVAYQSIDLLVSGNISEHEAQKALSMVRQNQPVSLEIPTPKPVISTQNPPWGNGFGSFQNTKSAKDEPIISSLFASEIISSLTPQGGATSLNNPPLAAKEPDKKKPLLGAAFGGDESSAS